MSADNAAFPEGGNLPSGGTPNSNAIGTMDERTFVPFIRRPPAFGNLRRVTLLFLTATLFLWPKYLVFAPSLSPFTLAVLLSIGVAAFLIVVGSLGGYARSISALLTIVAFVLFYTVRFVSDFSSENPSRTLYFDSRDFALGGSLFLVSISLARFSYSLDQVGKWICYCAIIVGAVTIVESFSGESLPRIILSSLPIRLDPQFLSMLTADNTRDSSLRAQGTFTHPIILGEIAAAMLPIAVSVFLGRRVARLIPILAIFGCLVALASSGSRAAVIALLVGSTCQAFLLIMASRRQVVWAAAFVVMPLVILAAPIAFDKVTELAVGRSAAERQSTGIREQQWDLGRSAIEKRPLFGYGGGSSPELAGVGGRFGIQATIDNFYLSMLLDSGIVGTTLFALFILLLVVVVLRTNMSQDRRRISIGYLSAIIAIVVCQSAVSLTEGMAFLYFFAGLLLAKDIRPNAPNRLNQLV